MVNVPKSTRKHISLTAGRQVVAKKSASVDTCRHLQLPSSVRHIIHRTYSHVCLSYIAMFVILHMCPYYVKPAYSFPGLFLRPAVAVACTTSSLRRDVGMLRRRRGMVAFFGGC